MAQQYEFLVGGMPELLLDDSKGLLPFKTFMGEVEIMVESPDIDIVTAMRLPIDNRNLVRVLENKEEFEENGNFSRVDLENAVRNMSDIPDYMQVFLLAYKENRLPFPGLTAVDQLSLLFYYEMSDSENEFLRQWYDFDISLRNVLVGINMRKNLSHIEAIATERDRPSALTLVGRGIAAEAVLKSTSPDFGLSSEFPWVERVLSLSGQSLTEMEKGLDNLRWDILNELTAFSYFEIEAVAAFTQKLLIAERWLKLEPEAGKARLDKLIEEMMSSFEMPEGF